MREAWTDERLDDLTRHMDREFDHVRSDLREIRIEVASMQRTLVIGFAGIAGSVVASAVGAILATQL